MLPIRLLRCSGSRFKQGLRFTSTFEDAQKKMKMLPEEPDASTKLQIYGLFKQGTDGDAAGSRPDAFDFAGQAKFDAWKSNEGLSKEEAQKKYAELIESLLKDANVSDGAQHSYNSTSTSGLKISTEDKILKIQLDRPDKFNAITWEMYEGIIEAMDKASRDRSTSLTVITGSGEYFSSGNDLSNFTCIKSPEDMIPLAEKGVIILERLVRSFILHKKPLVALINGPAIGISVTVLALCDLVIASDKATFVTPFTSLGQSPEGCSTITFPALMGTSKASEVLLFGKKLTAEEAMDRNLVAQVIPHAQFREETERKVVAMSKLPPESLRVNKCLIREGQKEKLIEANHAECSLLKKRWLSAECAQALQSFVTRKKQDM